MATIAAMNVSPARPESPHAIRQPARSELTPEYAAAQLVAVT